MDKLRFLGILVVAFLLSLFAQGVFLNASEKSAIEQNKEDTNHVLSATTAPEKDTTPAGKSNLSTPLPVATQSIDIHAFIYPGSQTIYEGEKSMTLKSTDDPATVTGWYKDKIKSLSMKVTTFISTNSNGAILNKLVAANGQVEVNVEIAKQENDSTVSISVNF